MCDVRVCSIIHIIVNTIINVICLFFYMEKTVIIDIISNTIIDVFISFLLLSCNKRSTVFGKCLSNITCTV